MGTVLAASPSPGFCSRPAVTAPGVSAKALEAGNQSIPHPLLSTTVTPGPGPPAPAYYLPCLNRFFERKSSFHSGLSPTFVPNEEESRQLSETCSVFLH